MSPTLAFNLVLLVAVAGLMIWFPDKLSLVPLIISKVQRPNETNDGRLNGPSRRSRPRPRPGAADRRSRPATSKKAKKLPRKAKKRKTTS